MHAAVSCVIPGAKTSRQAQDNTAAADLPQLSDEVMDKVSQIYQTQIRDSVHHYW